jgi:hypothetical protein
MPRFLIPCLGAALLCVCGLAAPAPAALVSDNAGKGTITAGTSYESSGTYADETVNAGKTATLGGMAYDAAAAAIPEPSTLGLIATSLLVICGRKRKALKAS